MTTDDAVRTTDAWGRPIEDGVPVFGPPDGEENIWPTASMRVFDDEHMVTCTTRFARAYSSAYYLTIWFFCLDEDGWTTRDIAELLDLPALPPADAFELLTQVTSEVEEMAPGCSVLVAIAAPDGGDRGTREESWTRTLLESAEVTGLPVRGVVAVGAHRARVLYSSGSP